MRDVRKVIRNGKNGRDDMADELDQKLIRKITEFLDTKGIYGVCCCSVPEAAETLQNEARRKGQNQAKRKIHEYMAGKIAELESFCKEKEYGSLADTADSMRKYLEDGYEK